MKHTACVVACLLAAVGCGPETVETPEPASEPAPPPAPSSTATNPLRNAYFGDLHVHTTNSFDAYNFGVRATPDDAYRFAQGEEIEHPLGYGLKLRSGPLDFYAVTDHALYLGVIPALDDPEHPLGKTALARLIQSDDPAENNQAFTQIGVAVMHGKPVLDIDTAPTVRSTWASIVDAAERHNQPGQFTTFVGYEYTSTPSGANLHRNIIFAGTEVPDVPFGVLDSPNPEDLWSWLDVQRAKGIEALAIPHNANWSQGLMFQRTNWAGEPLDSAYAEQRIRNEPIVEITQVKGTSEAHPELSPGDEWAAFEIWWDSTSEIDPATGAFSVSPGATTGAYARDALRTGLDLAQSLSTNPYQFGFIGSSDGHDAASPVEEDSYFGKLGFNDGSPEIRGSVPSDAANDLGVDTLEWGASGLAGVWAEENTRESIYAAFRRKEVFATSGPRISVRFFAGFGYPDALLDGADGIERAYATGVPMGAELGTREGEAPAFAVWAARDPDEGALQRAQIVKGWLADGESHERVFDVACADGGTPDPETFRCPDNGASVDLTDCSVSADVGANELTAVWRDPTFKPAQRAFYYARVLQNPSCRWSTWDAIRAGVAPVEQVPSTIQERAWSSPIWIEPAR